MLMQPTLQMLYQFKLLGMAHALEEQLKQPDLQHLSFEERLGLLLDRESLDRENRRLKRLLSQAKLRYHAYTEDIDYHHPRGLDRAQFNALVSCDFIRQHHHVIFTGPTGCGKSYLACALGHQACRQGLTVRYLRMPRLCETLRIAHADGSYARFMNQLAKVDLIIFDDFGIDQLSSPARQDLLEIVEDRNQLKSLLITSQLDVSHWHTYIGEPTVADAILDRILHNAHQFKLRGESMRKIKKVDASRSLEA